MHGNSHLTFTCLFSLAGRFRTGQCGPQWQSWTNLWKFISLLCFMPDQSMCKEHKFQKEHFWKPGRRQQKILCIGGAHSVLWILQIHIKSINSKFCCDDFNLDVPQSRTTNFVDATFSKPLKEPPADHLYKQDICKTLDRTPPTANSMSSYYYELPPVSCRNLTFWKMKSQWW